MFNVRIFRSLQTKGGRRMSPQEIYKYPLQCGFQKGHKQFNTGKTWFKKGYKPTKEHKEKISTALIGKKRVFDRTIYCLDCKKKLGSNAYYNKNIRCYTCAKKGELNYQWKGGFRRYFQDGTPAAKKDYEKEWRHRFGISKKYISELGFSYTKEYKKLQRKKRKALMKGGGELSIRQIQMVYEDNIKKYGTLTCYLCLKPVEFKKDHLEHKIPLSRGGTNEYNNLAISCQSCNCKKYKKTEQEYRKEFCPSETT